MCGVRTDPAQMSLWESFIEICLRTQVNCFLGCTRRSERKQPLYICCLWSCSWRLQTGHSYWDLSYIPVDECSREAWCKELPACHLFQRRFCQKNCHTPRKHIVAWVKLGHLEGISPCCDASTHKFYESIPLSKRMMYIYVYIYDDCVHWDAFEHMYSRCARRLKWRLGTSQW